MLNKTLTKTRKVIKGNFQEIIKQIACFDVSIRHFYARHNHRNVLRKRALRRPLFFKRPYKNNKDVPTALNFAEGLEKSFVRVKTKFKLICEVIEGIHRTPMKLLNPHLSSRIEVCSKQNI